MQWLSSRIGKFREMRMGVNSGEIQSRLFTGFPIWLLSITSGLWELVKIVITALTPETLVPRLGYLLNTPQLVFTSH